MSDSEPRLHRVTITDIARALGVTATTVSNALNRPDQLSPALRERVLATAREMGYAGPDPAARSMRYGRIPTIGVLYSDRLSNAFVDDAFVAFLRGLSGVLEDAGYCLTLIPGGAGRGSEPDYVRKSVVDAFLVYSMASDDPLVAAAQDRQLPVVVVDSPQGSGIPVVGIDDAAAASEAARHLLALGHRDIAVLSGELGYVRRSGAVDRPRLDAATYEVNRARLEGYIGACAATGLKWQQLVIEEVGSTELDEETRQAAYRILTREPRPTALLAMSDRMALQALRIARELGIRVPDELSIVGFDDIPAASTATPPLTTVRQPHAAKGETAARNLIALRQGQEVVAHVTLAAELIIRGSTREPRIA